MQRKLFVLFSGLVLLSLMIAPLGPAGAQSPLPPPPSPKNLSPEIEQARARQAMESVLAKYLVYWGPRYQLSLGEVTVDGEWAHGVTEWQSQTKTLSGPIHILAHRSSDGTWQALLPGADGAYLQWLEAMPERLMPASEKSQLRAQAAEANALRRPQTTPAVPPAASVMPLNQGGQGGPIGPISSQAQPTATPTAGASPLQVDESWMKFSNPLLGYSLKYPPNMYYREWNPAVDILHSVSFYLLKDSEQPPWQVPEIEVSIFENPQRLTSMEWILAHLDRLGIKAIEGSAAFFQNVTEIVPMTIDSREALTFNEILGGLSATRVILAHDNIVFSISYTDFGDRKLQAIYWAVVSTLRLSFPFETLSRPVDNSMNHISPSADKQITIILPTSPGYRLPWTGGETYRVAQSWGGSTHTCPGQMCYAYDFDNGGTSFEGVAIRASEGGSVAFIKNDVSPDTCGGYDYRNMANYVTIYHSDGTATLYLHLRQVNVGYGSIGQGTIVGLAGKTGYTVCYPHLHFQRQSQGAWIANSTPIYFDEYPGAQFQYGEWKTSQNSGAGSDTTKPDGDITSPSEGATISSRTVHLAGWASDSQSGFNHAHFTAQYSGSWRQVGSDFTSSPFGFDWDMCDAGVPDGPVTLGLDIWDNASNQANSPHGVRHFTKNYNCSPPPPSCNPNADQVALYANTGYGGSCVTLGVGDYPNPGYLSPLGNDNAESIKVGSNVQAILYEHDNYNGRTDTFTGDDSNLWDNTIGGNVVSSVKVQWHAQPPAAPSPQAPANGYTFVEGTPINLAWSATGNEYYGEVWGGPGGTLTFGWQSEPYKSLGPQWAGYAYSWQVKARNGAGASGWSDTWSFTVRPDTPSNLSAQTASCSQVNLYWTDNSGNEEGYKIYRNGTYVGQVGMNSTSYQDTGLNENTSYSYYVKAFRGSIESGASNTVDISTPTCAPPMPDLTPAQWGGWQYPIVPSSVTGTSVVNTLYANLPTYIDWGLANNGNADSGGDAYGELYIDSTRVARYNFGNVTAGISWAFLDWQKIINTSGLHTLKVIVDPDNLITESDETNNVWESQFYWTTSAPYADDMENGNNDWTATGLWHQVDASSPYPNSYSGSQSWWYGQDSTGNYDTSAANSGDLTSPSVYIPAADYYLRFWYQYETETQGQDWDQRWVQISVDGGAFNNVLQLSDDPINYWLQSPAIDLSGYAGHTIQVRFRFDTLDAYWNDYRGWYIDDFDISTTPPPNCTDSHESNNNASQATVITYGQTLSAEICPGGDFDFYTFTGLAEDKVVVDIDAKVNDSLLDSYVILLDSDGTSVLTEHDDEITYEVQDSKLGYQLSHDGTYYIKVKAWDHPSVGGTDYFYTIHLLTDDVNPSSATITSPANDAWLNPGLETVTVTASDNESGINRVEFFWHSADWENSDWVWLGADYDGRDGWSWDFDTSGLPAQQGGAFYIWAFDWVGNWTGAGSWNLGIARLYLPLVLR